MGEGGVLCFFVLFGFALEGGKCENNNSVIPLLPSITSVARIDDPAEEFVFKNSALRIKKKGDNAKRLGYKHCLKR